MRRLLEALQDMFEALHLVHDTLVWVPVIVHSQINFEGGNVRKPRYCLS